MDIYRDDIDWHKMFMKFSDILKILEDMTHDRYDDYDHISEKINT